MLAYGNPMGLFLMASGGLSFCKSSGCQLGSRITGFLAAAAGSLQSEGGSGGGGGGSPLWFNAVDDDGPGAGRGGGSGTGWDPSALFGEIAKFVYGEARTAQSQKVKRQTTQAQRVWFFGVGGAAYISSAPGGTTKGIGREVSFGLACENWSCLFYKSTGEVELNDPYGGKVAGGSVGVGPVGGYMDGGFNSFLGESTQKSLTIGLGTYTTIESGGQIGASAGLSKGQGLSAVVVRTRTAPLKWSDVKPW